MKITTINSIEVSSLCDNACEYCPASVQGEHRPVGFMTMEIFIKAISQVQKLCHKGTQKELNLFGVGEPTLNPKIVEMVTYARARLPSRVPVHLNTNGNTMTVNLAERLHRAGVNHMDITGHNPRAAANCIRIFRHVGIEGQLSMDAVVNPNNWAGQVSWFEPQYEAGPCPWLKNGQVMVMSDGRITHCCIDAFATGIVGNIADNLEEIDLAPFALCENCHHET